jgi:hypothetical protein
MEKSERAESPNGFPMRPHLGRQPSESRLPIERIKGPRSEQLGPVGAIRAADPLRSIFVKLDRESLFRQFEWSHIKHRIKEDRCKAAIAVAVEVRAGFDHVVGI